MLRRKVPMLDDDDDNNNAADNDNERRNLVAVDNNGSNGDVDHDDDEDSEDDGLHHRRLPWCSIGRFIFVTLPIFLVLFVRLILYVLVLIPLFIRFVYYYTIASQRRVIRYGNDSIRQSLDVFDPLILLPAKKNNINNTRGVSSSSSFSNKATPATTATTTTEMTPIVFFVCGGAWIIGYKMWGALLARVLTKTGVTVILADYRNYPWGVVSESIHDVRMALEWTKQLGRPIVAVGQSAGSHLLLTLFLQQLLLSNNNSRNNNNNNNNTKNNPQHKEQPSASSTCTDHEPAPRSPALLENIHGLICLSGPFDLEAMRTRFRKCGMDEGFVDRIFGHNLAAYDPMLLLDRINNHAKGNWMIFPPIRIYHGTADVTVPVQVAHKFCDKFQQKLKPYLDQVKYYDGWSHTDPILEGPADGDHRFHRDVFDAVCTWVPSSTQGQQPLHWPDESDPILQPLSFHPLVQLARFFMPF